MESLLWSNAAYRDLLGRWGLIAPVALRALLLSYLWHTLTGTYLHIISGRRSYAKQAALHADYLAGRIAHDAAPRSWHLVGRAFDIAPLPPGSNLQILGEIANVLGLRWGGTFSGAGYAGDVDHFDMPGPNLPAPAYEGAG